jgi:hypothetical protein
MVRMATYVEQLTPTLDGTILLNGSIQQGDQLTESFVTQPVSSICQRRRQMARQSLR